MSTDPTPPISPLFRAPPNSLLQSLHSAIREKQALQVLQFSENYSKTHSTDLVIIGGDLNSTPGSPVYRLFQSLTDTMVDLQGPGSLAAPQDQLFHVDAVMLLRLTGVGSSCQEYYVNINNSPFLCMARPPHSSCHEDTFPEALSGALSAFHCVSMA